MKWQEKSFDQEIADKLANSAKLSPILAKLLAERNIESIADVEAFISPKLAHLSDPFSIKNMDRAVGRVKDVIKKMKKFFSGDYDVMESLGKYSTESPSELGGITNHTKKKG